MLEDLLNNQVGVLFYDGETTQYYEGTVDKVEENLVRLRNCRIPGPDSGSILPVTMVVNTKSPAFVRFEFEQI